MTTGLGFPDRKVMAELTAKMLLEVEAVRFMEDKPFIFTSGWASPVYTDCRRLISFPRVRQTLIDFGTATVLRDVGFEQFDTVVGGETAGIPFAAWMADRLMLPMQYVRKKPKGFGRNAQIEGHLEPGQRVRRRHGRQQRPRGRAAWAVLDLPAKRRDRVAKLIGPLPVSGRARRLSARRAFAGRRPAARWACETEVPPLPAKCSGLVRGTPTLLSGHEPN